MYIYSRDRRYRIPPEIVPYSNSLTRLHFTPRQLLQEVNHWITEWTYAYKRSSVYFTYYDENDPDLLIEPIDDTNYRRTLAICFEAYLKRQLLLLYTPPASENIQNIQNIVLKNLMLSLPTMNAYSTNPNDIRKQCVRIKCFSLNERGCYTETIPPAYRHFTWYSKQKNCGEQLPKFRCCPALFNSMDCMELLHNNMEFASKELMIKIAYYLRPFRFFLPLTFMFDIFGGFRDSPIEFNFPDHTIKNRFPDSYVLADKLERSFLEDFKKQTRSFFSEEEVILPRRANAFLAGGCLSFMLGLTTQFNDLDIFIEYDPEVFTFITFMGIIVTSDDGSRTRERIWVPQDDYDHDHFVQKCNSDDYSDPKIVFQNRKLRTVKIRSVYQLNPKLKIVEHWQKKYAHLPQIIFIDSKFKFDEYNILKMITSFDLSICRYALAFMHAKAFHLRESILENLYGFKQINENSNVIDFVNKWQNDEEIEFSRKMNKIKNFKNILPNERRQEYIRKRLVLENDVKQKDWYIKQQRKMKLIKWPYDTNPMFDVTEEKTKNRIEKYLKRLPQPIVDFEGNRTLPMQVYPLKYLAYWELQKNVININQNCLCNFNYCFEYSIDDDNEKPSTSSSYKQ